MAEKQIEKRSAIGTDVATAEDRLGFEPYTDTLSEVIRYSETPLTIGIFGAWGSGKTSLLMMLEKSLRKQETEPRTQIVWFNAWQYGQETALWRALLSRVLDALGPSALEESGKGEVKNR